MCADFAVITFGSATALILTLVKVTQISISTQLADNVQTQDADRLNKALFAVVTVNQQISDATG